MKNTIIINDNEVLRIKDIAYVSIVPNPNFVSEDEQWVVKIFLYENLPLISTGVYFKEHDSAIGFLRTLRLQMEQS